MKLREVEARKKFCPRTMAVEGISPYCVASECMAWRWDAKLSVDNPTQAPGLATQKITRDVGHCGLAGST